jgi:thioester reductase-like protein
MSIFVTGTTGYIGSYITEQLLRNHRDRLSLLVRAKSKEEAARRLWKSFQLHMDFEEFTSYLGDRIEIYLGDLTLPELGLSEEDRKKLIHTTDSVIHCAASLNRRSEKACLNVNLRGTLEVVKVARAAHEHHGLRRFSDISTTAVAGHRKNEIVTEEKSVEWDRSDYDPYARTKKFCEHMVHELLPEVSTIVFRPSTVLGDSRFPQTTQFDMVRAFVWFAQLPLIPLAGDWKHDIVNVDYVAKSLVTIHQKDKPAHRIYHLSSGASSQTYNEIVSALNRKPTFVPLLSGPFGGIVNFLAFTPRELGISGAAGLIKVFWPYMTFNTVFDNRRVADETGQAPVPFSNYAKGLFEFASNGRFQYPYKPWPVDAKEVKVA